MEGQEISFTMENGMKGPATRATWWLSKGAILFTSILNALVVAVHNIEHTI